MLCAGLQSISLDARFDNQYKFMLRSLGFSPNITNNQGQTFLHDAVIDNDLSEVRDLLMDPAIEVNAQDNQDQTPLDIAIIYGYNDIIPLLIKAGAKINRLNRYGITPLHIAAINNNVGAILLLLDAGAFIDAQCMNLVEYQGDTPLHFAVLNNATEAVRILLNAGANTKIVNKNGKTAQQLIEKNLKMIDLFISISEPDIQEILNRRKEERNFNNQMRQQFGVTKNRSMSPELFKGPLIG